MQAILGGVIRALLALFAGTVGTTDADLMTALNGFLDGLLAGNANQIGSAALTLAVIIWSIYSKKKEAKEKAQ